MFMFMRKGPAASGARLLIAATLALVAVAGFAAWWTDRVKAQRGIEF